MRMLYTLIEIIIEAYYLCFKETDLITPDNMYSANLSFFFFFTFNNLLLQKYLPPLNISVYIYIFLISCELFIELFLHVSKFKNFVLHVD